MDAMSDWNTVFVEVPLSTFKSGEDCELICCVNSINKPLFIVDYMDLYRSEDLCKSV